MGESSAAISLRGVVKRFGAITAVDGLDLEVQARRVLRPARSERGGQVDDDADAHRAGARGRGEIAVLGYTLPDESKRARIAMGVVPQLDNLDVELTCRQVLAVFARLYRVPRAARAAAVERALEIANLRGPRGHARGRALGRDAPAPAGRARLDPPAPPRAVGRADGGPRPAGPPGAVVADRPPALGRGDGADVDALHRGGRATRGQGRGDVEGADRRGGTPAEFVQVARGRAGTEDIRTAGGARGGGRARATGGLGRAGAAARRSRSCARRR